MERPLKTNGQWLVAVVIVVVPVAIVVPAMAVFVPPAVALVPAAFAGFTQFVACVVRLPAVPAVAFSSFVKFMVGLGDAPLATVVVIGVNARCCRESQKPNRRGSKQHAFQKLLLSRVVTHGFSILHFPPTGMGRWSHFIKHACKKNVAAAA